MSWGARCMVPIAAFVSVGWGGVARAGEPAAACAALKAAAGVESAVAQSATVLAAQMGQPARQTSLPAHCEVFGRLEPRVGADGQHYAIRYHLRLPLAWNGRFLFQGGAGTNGEVGDASGPVGSVAPAALVQGYAVVSQDSGHDNATNTVAARGGQAAFGADGQARANYGGASLPKVVDQAKMLITRFYGRAPTRSYFFGCSKGGEEGMALAQRYPNAFDGIVAGAPGFALPRAALAQVWDVQSFGRLLAPGPGSFPVAKLPAAFSDANLARVRAAVLRACDRLDGLADGIVGAFARCTATRVRPELDRIVCKQGVVGDCLSRDQLAALRRVMSGPRGAGGARLYADWAWDGGVGADGWRLWKLGSARMPALNVLTGGPALAMMFTVPPTPIRNDPQSLVDYEMGFDFPTQAGRIYATDGAFPRSAWQDISARSPDLDAFRAHGGKLIVPHGASDPVFSINDTLAWYDEVQRRYRGGAADFARVFAVPGMNHCGGGPSTDGFDALAAVVDWVEQGKAPDRIEAVAGPATPWPDRRRPLCPFPRVAIYAGSGSAERSENFLCKDL